MADDDESEKKREVNLNLNPDKVSVTYAHGVAVTNSPQKDVVILNFTQPANPLRFDDNHNIVSRIALSTNKAKDLLNSLGDHIERQEL